jgi:hypothetical protein
LGDELDPGTIKEVIVKVAEMRKITVGDKLLVVMVTRVLFQNCARS